LATHKVLSQENKLHLVEDEVNLFFVLEGAISLNLDFLDDLSGLINLAISFVHLNHLSGALRVLALEEHFSIAGLSEGGE